MPRMRPDNQRPCFEQWGEHVLELLASLHLYRCDNLLRPHACRLVAGTGVIFHAAGYLALWAAVRGLIVVNYSVLLLFGLVAASAVVCLVPELLQPLSFWVHCLSSLPDGASNRSAVS